MRRFCFWFFLALLSMNSLVPWAAAQQASGLDTETGMRPFRSYDSGSIDTVNLSNGKLQVNIPLISYSQRGGKLKLDYQLTYRNTGMFVPGCLPTAFSDGVCVEVWPFDSGFFAIEANRPGGGASCGSQIVTDVFGSQLLTYKCGASVVSPDGAPHPVAPTGPTTFRAIDGSGYRVDLLPGSVISNMNHVAGVITDRFGNKYYQQFYDSLGNGNIYAEDPNGNQIFSSGGELFDTMGRVIPGFGSIPDSLPGPWVQGIGINDFTGCVGPLPTVGATVWNPPGVDGGDYPIKFCFALVPEVNPGGLNEFEFCGPPPANCQQFDVTMPALPTTAIQMQSVILPNGTAWVFQYSSDGFGNLSQITLPTGGTISYIWTAMDLDGPAQVNSLPPMTKIRPQGIAQRIISPNDGTSPSERWSYSYIRGTVTPGGIMNGNFVTTVTDPGGNDTVHTFGIADEQGDIFETLTQTYNGPAGNGQLLRTVQTDYQSVVMQSPAIGNLAGVFQSYLPIRYTTTLDNGLQGKIEQDWDPGFLVDVSAFDSNLVPQPCGQIAQKTGSCSGGAPYGVILTTREYDLAPGAPGPLLRTTFAPRLALSTGGNSYFSNNMLELLSSKIVTDANSNVAARTTFGYDESGLASSGISTQHNPNPPAGAARGNLTSVTHQVAAPVNSCNAAATSSVTSSTQWFDTGEVSQQKDALGNTTTYSYSSAFAGALPTQVCNALNQCVSSDYDFNLALKTRFTDLNNQTSSFQYDVMGRITQVTAPAQVVNGSVLSGTTVFTYNDTPGSLSVQRTRQQDGATSTIDFQFFDGLGRPNGTRLVDPEGDIFSATAYDTFGRVSTVTNPYRSKSDATFGVTRTDYDALGRVSQVTHPDGSQALTSYAGRAVEVQDEGNGSSRITRISQTDVLGRLTSVCEVTNATQINGDAPMACGLDLPATGFLTSYQYDILGNLTGVQQGSVARSFIYDSASRLLNATNPESGTTCYQYDANGNILKRTRPAPNQSNPLSTVTTTYTYDQLNRLINTSYSDTVTPGVSRHYDTSWEMGVPLNNTVGRLSAEYVTSAGGQRLSAHIYSYDAIGRIVDSSQCTPQNCATSMFPVQYSYDLLGKPLTFTNGQGVTFGYSYDGAGRLTSMTSSLSGANYPATLFSGAQYNPFGGITSASIGNTLTEALAFDNRGRLTNYSSAIQPSTAQLINQGTEAPTLSRKLDRLKIEPQATFTRRLILPTAFSRASLGSIIISSSGERRKHEHGSLTVSVLLTTQLQPAATVKVSYRSGETPAAIAQRLANRINADQSIGLKASVQQQGTTARVELVRQLGYRVANLLLSTSVSSNRKIPGITVSAADLLYARPFLLGQMLTPERSHQ